MSADELLALLQRRHATDEWAFFPQVRNGTGFSADTVRTADAMALNLWPSRGLELHGFEIKVSRADWMRELATPAKAEEMAQFCDRWWVVAPADLIGAAELPRTWGLMIPDKKGKMVVKVAAPILKAKPMTRLFMASLFRKAKEYTMSPKMKAAVTKHALEEAKQQWDNQRSWREKDGERLAAAVKTFEEKSGVKIDDWNAERIGEAVKIVMDQRGLEKVLEDLVFRRRSLEHELKEATELSARLEAHLNGKRHV